MQDGWLYRPWQHNIIISPRSFLTWSKREEANWVSRNVEYMELTVEPYFQDQFMQAMQIPHVEDAFPPPGGIVPQEILHQK